MRPLALVFIFCFSLLITAQNTINKKLGSFSTVKVYDLINLKMIAASENKIKISGTNKDDVEVINKNGKLKIRMALQESFDGGNTEVVLYYKSITTIDANEGAKVEVSGIINQYEIELKTQEGAEITAQLDTKFSTLRAVTGGIINLKGTSKNQDITITTGGIVNAKNCITERTEIAVKAAGEGYIHATKKAKASVKAGGEIFIYGNPKTIDEKRILGGRIKRM